MSVSQIELYIASAYLLIIVLEPGKIIICFSVFALIFSMVIFPLFYISSAIVIWPLVLIAGFVLGAICRRYPVYDLINIEINEEIRIFLCKMTCLATLQQRCWTSTAL